MLKIVAGLAGVVLCLPLMLAGPSFSQGTRPGLPPLQPIPPLPQPVPIPPPSSAPLPPPQQSPQPQLGAPATPLAPGLPEDANVDTSRRRDTLARPRDGETRHHRDGVLGRHVREGYVTPWSGPYVIERAHGYEAFVVQGHWFHAQPVCWGWKAGERVSLRAGPYGECVLLNRARHRACPVSCDGYPGWGPYL